MLENCVFVTVKVYRYYTSDSKSEGIKELEEHKISTWRETFEKDGKARPLVTIDPSER